MLAKRVYYLLTDVGRRRYLLLLGWCGFIAISFGYLLAYCHSPGPIGSISGQLDSFFKQPPSGKRWLLTMGMHPKCPCTSAAITELERLMLHVHKYTQARVFVYSPAEFDESWVETSNLQKLRSVSGVEVNFDKDGQIMRQLGIVTSGGVLLFDHSGKLQFRGGITSARGQEGDSLGAQVIRDLVHERDPLQRHAPVYGCGILPQQGAE